MKPSSCGTFFTLLCIPLVLFFSRATAQSGFPFSLTCPASLASGPPWWSPLRATNGQDPCQIVQSLEKTFNLFCCATGSGAKNNSNMSGSQSSGKGSDYPGPGNSKGPMDNRPCGPCNLQTYNVASACFACMTLGNRTVDSAEAIGTLPFAQSLDKWEQNSRVLDTFDNSTVPTWALIPPPSPGNVFNIQSVLQAAGVSPTIASSSLISSVVSSSQTSSASSTPSSADAASIPSSADASSTSGSSPLRNSKSSGSPLGAIVGGVIGGLVLLALVIIVVIYFFRRRDRRRKLQYAPSAEFTQVVASRPGFATSEVSPSFSTGAWRNPVLERVHGAGAMQRGLDSGVYPGESSWGRDVEKSSGAGFPVVL